MGAFIEFCDENCITIERASPYNPTSNSSAEKNVGILKKCLKNQLVEEMIFLQQFFVLQNLPRTSGVCHQHVYFSKEKSGFQCSTHHHATKMNMGLVCKDIMTERGRETRPTPVVVLFCTMYNCT